MKPHRLFLSLATLLLLGTLVAFVAPGDRVTPAFAKRRIAAPDVAANWITTGNKIQAGEFLGTKNNQPLVFKTNKVERMRLDTLGNVGIGTNAPGSKLTVAGVVQSTSGGFKFPDGTTQTTASVAGPNGWALGGNAGINPATNFVGTTDNQSLVFKTNNGERMRIGPTGNVGIGMANPGNKLDVQGSVSTFNGVALGLYNSNDANTNHWALGTGGAVVPKDAFSIGDSSSYKMTILSNGTVGIGTTTPCATAKLHVYAGDATLGCYNAAVFGESSLGVGVYGISKEFAGVWGRSLNYAGVYASSNNSYGIYSQSSSSRGIYAYSGSDTAVYGKSDTGAYIFEGKDGLATDVRRFAVERATGNVRADGSFTAPADFAEMMPVRGMKQDYTVGDVVVIGPDGKIALSDKANAANLAGVYSAQPGFVGDTEIAAHGIEYYDQPETQQRIAVALVGIVPVKVTDENGAIRPGDLLTTSSTPGYAMKAKPAIVNGIEIYPTGTILGKALESWERGKGVIQVLVTLR